MELEGGRKQDRKKICRNLEIMLVALAFLGKSGEETGKRLENVLV